jgi:hypothetical protein
MNSWEKIQTIADQTMYATAQCRETKFGYTMERNSISIVQYQEGTSQLIEEWNFRLLTGFELRQLEENYVKLKDKDYLIEIVLIILF